MKIVTNPFYLVKIGILFLSKVCLWVSIITAFSTSAKATHMLGGYISYEYINKDSIRVKITHYKDCNGMSSNDGSLTLYDSTYTQKRTLKPTYLSVIEITPITKTKNSCTKCLKNSPNSTNSNCSFPYGASKYVSYIDINITWLPSTLLASSNPCILNLVWNQCCMVDGYTTAKNDLQFYLEAKVNLCNLKKLNDNSPVAKNTFFFLAPINQDVIYNYGFQDIDNRGGKQDFSRFFLDKPKILGKRSNYYTGNYDYKKPIQYLGYPNLYKRNQFNPPNSSYGFHIDSMTGDLLFRPTALHKSFFSFDMVNYAYDSTTKKYVWVSTMVVVAPLYSINNPNNTVPEINPLVSDSITVCPNSPLVFKVFGNDVDTFNGAKRDSVKLNALVLPKGAAFTVYNSKQKMAIFEWTPTDKQISDVPHLLIIKAIDNFAPIYGERTKTIRIYVKPAFSIKNIIGNDTTIHQGSSIRIGSLPKNGFNYLWGNGNTTSQITVSPANTTYYKLKISDTINNCVTTDSIKITVIKPVCGLAGCDTSMCDGDSVLLGSTPKIKNAYYWSSNQYGFSSIIPNPKVSPNTNTKYYLAIYDSTTSIVYYDTVSVTVNKKPYVYLGNDTAICQGDSLFIGVPPLGNSTFIWNNSVSNSSQYIKNSGTYILTETTTATGCKNSDSIHISTKSLPIFYLGRDTSVRMGTQLQFGVQQQNNFKYTWNTGDTISRITRTIVADTSFSLTVTNNLRCNYTDTVNVTILNSIITSLNWEDKTNINRLNIYPNPSESSLLFIKGVTESASIRILDISGKIVFSTPLKISNNQSVNTSLSQGIYLVQILLPNQVVMKKWMIR